MMVCGGTNLTYFPTLQKSGMLNISRISVFLFGMAGFAQGAGVINWVATNGDAGFSGGSEATNSPVTTDADGETIVGSFPAVTLGVGQAIVLSGGVNIGGTGTIPGNQFRWGFFDAPGVPATGAGSGYVGVWAAAPSGAAAANTVTADGSTTNPFSGSASTVVGSASDVGGDLFLRGADVSFTMTITRIDETQISIAAGFTNGTDLNV